MLSKQMLGEKLSPPTETATGSVPGVKPLGNGNRLYRAGKMSPNGTYSPNITGCILKYRAVISACGLTMSAAL